MDSTLQVTDLDEAILVISIKNDEINNLKSSAKAQEKKNSIKLTDLQFKLDQEKSRCAEIERKLAKAQESANKARQVWDEEAKKYQEERHRLSGSISELHTEMRKKEREFKAALFQSQIHLQREKQITSKLGAEIQMLHRHFDPKKILNILNRSNLEEIPSYIDLFKSGLQKGEELQQLSLEMEKLKSQTYLSIEQSFKKLSSYEAVMENLDIKNKELEENIKLKENELELHSLEINEKRMLLEAVKEHATEQVQQLSDQLHSLRTYVNKSDEVDSGTNFTQHQLDYHQSIEDLEAIIQQHENRFAEMQNQYQEKIVHLQEENEVLKKEIIEMHNNTLNQKEDFGSAIASIKRQIAQKDDLICLLNASIKEQQDFFQSKREEFDRYIFDLNELLKKKKKAEEDSRQNQIILKEQIQSLNEQISFLKHRTYNNNNQTEKSQSVNNETIQVQQIDQNPQRHLLRRARSGFESLRSIDEPRNLFADLKDNNQSVEDGSSKIDIGNYQLEPNWSQLYYNLLKKHNQFSRKVQGRLEAMAIRRRV